MTIQASSYAVPRADLGAALTEFDPATEGFIGIQILPQFDVAKESATMSVTTRENLKRVSVLHADGSAYNRANAVTEDKAFLCVDYGLEDVLTDKKRALYANDFDPELVTTTVLLRRLLIEQEIRINSLVFNTGTWTGDDLYTDNSGSPWDAAGSDIIGQILAAKEKVRLGTGMVADSMAIGAAALSNMLKNTGITGQFKGVDVITETVLRGALPSIFGIKNLFVGNAVYDSALEGQSFSAGDIWADDYAMVFKQQVGDTASGGLGRSPLWVPMTPEFDAVEQYREEQTKGDVFRVTQYTDELIFDAPSGHLMKIDIL